MVPISVSFTRDRDIAYHVVIQWPNSCIILSQFLVPLPDSVMRWTEICECYVSWIYPTVITCSHRIGDNRKCSFNKSTNAYRKSLETVFCFDCHFSPVWRQMAIETLSLTIFDLRSSIVWRFRLPPIRCDVSCRRLFSGMFQGRLKYGNIRI